MKLSTFAMIITILAAGFGLAFLFIPVKLTAFYGISLEGGGIIIARYFGVSNLFTAMIYWSYSSVSLTAKSWPKLLLFSIIYDILQLTMALIAQLNNEANSWGWSIVTLFALLAIGSGYYLVECNRARAQMI